MLGIDVNESYVKSLNETSKEDLTFFYSIKYKNYAQTTKAKICVTSEKLKKYLPKKNTYQKIRFFYYL